MNTGNNYAFPIVSTASNEEIKANYWKCLYTSADKNASVLGDFAKSC